MNWGSPEFVLGIIAISYVAWIVNNWIRAKHGYSLEDEWGGKSEKAVTTETRQPEAQNAQLMATMEKMQDRMVVLERIVTDKGYTVAEEIEALRDTPSVRDDDSGVPLAFARKEQA